ncbi:1737_t:CDS:2, partial [Entrophospora sp. SA101]
IKRLTPTDALINSDTNKYEITVKKSPSFGVGYNDTLKKLEDQFKSIHDNTKNDDLMRYGIINFEDKKKKESDLYTTLSNFKDEFRITHKINRSDLDVLKDEEIKQMLIKKSAISDINKGEAFLNKYGHKELYTKFDEKTMIINLTISTIRI